jgi:hypothetical protein
VIDEPWMTLSLSAPSAQIAAVHSASLVASLSNDSAGGRAVGPFFAPVDVRFGAPSGTLTPVTTQTDASLNARSSFAAGATPSAEVSATVDNQAVRLKFPHPPAPVLKATVTPDRDTVAPGGAVSYTVTVVNEGDAAARGLRACLSLGGDSRSARELCSALGQLQAGRTWAFEVRAGGAAGACIGELLSRLSVRTGGRRIAKALALVHVSGPPCSPRFTA